MFGKLKKVVRDWAFKDYVPYIDPNTFVVLGTRHRSINELNVELSIVYEEMEKDKYNMIAYEVSKLIKEKIENGGIELECGEDYMGRTKYLARIGIVDLHR